MQKGDRGGFVDTSKKGNAKGGTLRSIGREVISLRSDHEQGAVDRTWTRRFPQGTKKASRRKESSRHEGPVEAGVGEGSCREALRNECRGTSRSEKTKGGKQSLHGGDGEGRTRKAHASTEHQIGLRSSLCAKDTEKRKIAKKQKPEGACPECWEKKKSEMGRACPDVEKSNGSESNPPRRGTRDDIRKEKAHETENTGPKKSRLY